MKFARQVRFSIIKTIRFWNPRIAAFKLDLKFALEPLERIRNAPRDQQNADNNTNQITRSDIGRNPESNPPQTENVSRKTKWYHATENKKFWLEGLTLVFVIAAFGVYYFQGCQAKRQAVAAEQQLAEMQNARELDERAWVTVSQLTSLYTTINHGDPVEVSFAIPLQNTGKTPAINVVTVFSCKSIANSNWTDAYPNPVYSSFLIPAGSHDINQMPTSVLQQPYSNTLQAIKSGKPYYITGTIWYSDIFTNRHWTQFCYGTTWSSANATIAFTSTPIHNSCGDVQTNQSN